MIKYIFEELFINIKNNVIQAINNIFNEINLDEIGFTK